MKTFLRVLGFLLAMAGLCAISLLYFFGGMWFGVHVYGLSHKIVSFTAMTLLPLSLVLIAIPRVRVWGGGGLIVMSYLVGISLWCYAMIVTLLLWGWIGVLMGLLFMGVGIVPLGAFACLFGGHWGQLMEIVVLAGFVVAFQIGGAWAIENGETHNLLRREQDAQLALKRVRDHLEQLTP